MVGQLEAAPLREWLVQRRGGFDSLSAMAASLGIEERQLSRMIEGREFANGRWREIETVTLDMADRLLGEDLAVVYPGDDALEADAWCGRCHDMVTPIDGRCPWCESDTSAPAERRRGYCRAEHRMVWPANDGSCWRCGGPLESAAPWVECACSCGTLIRAFDPQGRPTRYARGHNPRTLERDGAVDAAPFREYLERELREMDLLGALARAHGIGRDEVVRVLNGDDATVSRNVVRRALWTRARGGLGKGLRPHPDAIGFFDLYPDDARSRTCPGCGGGKAAHAELCKRCRRRKGTGRGRRPPAARGRGGHRGAPPPHVGGPDDGGDR